MGLLVGRVVIDLETPAKAKAEWPPSYAGAPLSGKAARHSVDSMCDSGGKRHSVFYKKSASSAVRPGAGSYENYRNQAAA
jgi:hypothetical protein